MTNINELSPDVADAYREWAMGDDGATVDDFIHDECAVCIHTGKYIVIDTAYAVDDDYVSDDYAYLYLSDEDVANNTADEWRDSNGRD